MLYKPTTTKRERQKVYPEIIKEAVDKEAILSFIILADAYLFDNVD